MVELEILKIRKEKKVGSTTSRKVFWIKIYVNK